MRRRDLSPPPPPAGAGLLAGLVLRDNLRFRTRIEHYYRYAIGQAKSEILIANAYFVPGVALQRALLRAAQRGVQACTLLLQGRYEYFMQHHASRAMYGVMLDAGIEIIEYAPSFLHAKVAVFDGTPGRDGDGRLVQPRSAQPAARARGQRLRPRRRLRRRAARATCSTR